MCIRDRFTLPRFIVSVFTLPLFIGSVITVPLFIVSVFTLPLFIVSVFTLPPQMVNATQRTQMRITELGSRVMDNAQMTSELQLTLRDYQVLSERQYRLLQTHVIRLNNSLQDLQEDVSDLVHNVSAPSFSPLCLGSQRQYSTFLPSLPWFTTLLLHLSSLKPVFNWANVSSQLVGSIRRI